MAASVQDLIALAQAQQKPTWQSQLGQLINSTVQGYNTGQQIQSQRLALATEMLKKQALQQDLADKQKQAAFQEKLRSQVLPNLSGQPGNDATPAGKLKRKIAVDEKGNLSQTFETDSGTDVKPGETFTLPQLKAMGVTNADALAAQYPNGVPKEAVSVAQSSASNAVSASDRQTKEQQAAEEKLIGRIASIRGDTSVKRVEEQRDAAIQAYNTIASVKADNREPSKLEYYDILGQLWKARTGASPTEQSLKDLDQSTFKGDLGKAYTYFSGKPAGATTADVLQNIQDFAAQTGQQMDQMHDSYMKPHLIKPSGMSDQRYQEIVKNRRGLSFQEATAGDGASPAGGSSVAVPPPAQGMVRFKDSTGAIHDIPAANLGAAKKRDPGLVVQ